MEAFDTAVLLFTILIDVYMMYDFFENSFEVKELYKGKNKIWVILIHMLIIYGVNLIGNTYLNLICTILICISLSIILFDATIKSRIIHSFIAWMILIFGEFLFAVILEIPPYLMKISAVVNLADATWIVFAVKLMTYLIFVVVKQLARKGKHHMPTKIFMMYICQPVVSMLIMIVMFYSNASVVVTNGFKVSITISFAFLLVANVLMFYAFNQYALQMEINMQQKIKLIKQHADVEYYAQIAEINENHRRFIHDATNHFKAIGELAYSGNTENIIKIVNDCTGEIVKGSEKIYSNHSVVNAIFNDKMRIADANGVRFDIDADVDKSIINTIGDGDIICILGNLLDNALRASMECDNGSAYIKCNIFCKCDGRNLVIEVKNAYEGNLYRQKDIFLSTKKNDGLHGIGLKNVKQAVEKYDGFFECNADGREFTALAVLICNN